MDSCIQKTITFEQSKSICLLTLLLFNIPLLVNKWLHVELPVVLEAIILLFIFSAEILGEIGSFYTHISWWDTMLHTLNGFLMAAIGFALIDILNNSPKFHINLSPLFVAFVAFCFSMTVGVVWEFFKFFMDLFAHTDMQKDRMITDISSGGNGDPNSLPLIAKGANPRKVAEIILKGVRKGKRKIIVGTDAKAVLLIQKVLPVRYWNIIKRYVRS